MGRAPRSVWSDRDTALLRHAVSLYEYRKIDYVAVAQLFANRSPVDVKKRCAVLRDRERRRRRCSELRNRVGTTDSACTPPPEDEGQLHPALVWVPAEWHDLETITL
tara:strand:- start:6268 stop:6588 length:321 start_codon:yes stop_codon:yes gene_type:complete